VQLILTSPQGDLVPAGDHLVCFFKGRGVGGGRQTRW
jgi:hypothetical protein